MLTVIRWRQTFVLAPILGFSLLGCSGSGGEGGTPSVSPTADTTSPAVTLVFPRKDATGVSLTPAVTATFSKVMDASSLTATTFTVKDAQGNLIPGTISSVGATIIFLPSVALAPSSSYLATITAGVIDLARNALPSDYFWPFATGTVPDTTPPTVIATTPANGATAVPVNTTVTATFSKVMDASSINTATFTVKDASGNPVTGTVSYVGATATFSPATNLAVSTTYTATITTGAKDVAGNALLTNYSWTFATIVPDTTPPTVISTTPVNGATNVVVNTAVTVTFSEAMKPATINAASLIVMDPANNTVSGAISYAGQTATFTPGAALSPTTAYSATITTAVEDLAGNHLSSQYSWTFTTGIVLDTTPPSILSTTPVDGAINVAANTSVTVTFSEPMDPATLNENTFFVRYGTTGGLFVGTVSYSGVTAVFTPIGFTYDSLLTATITTGAKDLAGNAMAANYTWSFRIASAPVGVLDPTFGTDGKVITDISGWNMWSDLGDKVHALFIQPDGKIVAVGDSYAGPVNIIDFALARYNPDGTLDMTFGTGGKVMTDFGGDERIAGAVMQPDGKIVIAGSSSTGCCGDFALARYNTNGTLDTSFGTMGKVITDIGGNDYIFGIVILPTGKLLAAGYTIGTFTGTPTGTVLGRYNTDGSLDTTFGLGGKVIDSTLPELTTPSGLALQSDGKIVVTGAFQVVRYNADGTRDTTFGVGGMVDNGSYIQVEALVIQSNGKIVVSGWFLSGPRHIFTLARYNTDGTLNANFGAGGIVSTDFGGGTDASATTAAIQPDGKIVAAGGIAYYGGTGKLPDFALARYNPDGTLDTTFSTGGLATTDFTSSSDYAYAVAIQSDGKIIAAGYSNADFALARYLGN